METRKLDVTQVVGKEEPVTAYEVLDRKGALSPVGYRILELYHQGRKAYDAFEFAEAQEFFSKVLELDPHDGPSVLHVKRSRDYLIDAPKDLIFRPETK